jgi:hypothetical protein
MRFLWHDLGFWEWTSKASRLSEDPRKVEQDSGDAAKLYTLVAVPAKIPLTTLGALTDIIHDEFNNAVGTPSRGCLRL